MCNLLEETLKAISLYASENEVKYVSDGVNMISWLEFKRLSKNINYIPSWYEENMTINPNLMIVGTRWVLTREASYSGEFWSLTRMPPSTEKSDEANFKLWND